MFFEIGRTAVYVYGFHMIRIQLVPYIENIQGTLREVRRALLEADVALPVVQGFIGEVREKALGQEILQSLAAELEKQPGARITTAALARSAGVSEAALYRHFASKAKMFEALIEFAEESVFVRTSGCNLRVEKGFAILGLPRQQRRLVGFDKSTTEEAAEHLRRAAIELVPALEQAPIEHHWAGLRPGSPTGVPFIGEHPQIRGLFANAGHFRNGVVMGLASAQLMADLVLDREPAFDPEPFRLERDTD